MASPRKSGAVNTCQKSAVPHRFKRDRPNIYQTLRNTGRTSLERASAKRRKKLGVFTYASAHTHKKRQIKDREESIIKSRCISTCEPWKREAERWRQADTRAIHQVGEITLFDLVSSLERGSRASAHMLLSLRVPTHLYTCVCNCPRERAVHIHASRPARKCGNRAGARDRAHVCI